MKKAIRYNKRTFVFALLLVLAIMTAGCTTYDNFIEYLNDEEDDSDTIRIGIFEPMTGSDKEAALPELTGIELAHELYPTVLGKKVELVYADNKSDIVIAENAAGELVDQNVKLVLGSYGNTLSLAGGEVFKSVEIPAIAITCTNPLLTKANEYYFRVCIVDSFQGHMAAKYVYNELGADRAIVMKASDDDFGAALSQQFSDGLVRLTGNEEAITGTVEYSRGTADYQKQLEKIKSLDVDIVYLPGTAEEAAAIVKQARALGIDSVFLGTDQWYKDVLIEQGGEAAEGLVFTTFFDARSTLTDKTKEFLSAYREKYGEDDQPDSAVALGFDAYLLALDAIERHAIADSIDAESKAGASSLRDVLLSTREFQGATGEISFGEIGDPIKPVVFITVENGKFIYKYTAEPEWE